MQQKERDLYYSVRRGHLRASDRRERDEVCPRERITVSRRRRGIEVPDRAATMRKAVSVLALIAFACDISRNPLVHGDPIGNAEVARKSDDYEHQVTAKVSFSYTDELSEQIYLDIHDTSRLNEKFMKNFYPDSRKRKLSMEADFKTPKRLDFYRNNTY